MEDHTVRLWTGVFFSLILGALVLLGATTEYVLNQTLLIALLGLIGALLNINPFEILNSDNNDD